jgi:hypothetical protein
VDVRRSIVKSRAPSLWSLHHLEKVTKDPFAKNDDFVAAIDDCLNSATVWTAEASSHIGRAGYALLARLLEVHAGAAPASTGEVALREPRVLDAARRFCAQLTVGDIDLTDADIPRIVDELLAIEAVEDVFRRRYDLPPELDLSGSHLHRTGTTSAIFRCRWQGGFDVALKVTLARYFDVKALSDASQSYSKDYRTPSDISPRVHESGPRFIILDFVEGETLEERLSGLAVADPDPRSIQARVAEGFAVMLALMSALERLATSGESITARHHLDLTPNNVIIPVREGIPGVKFIDFGRNQLLVEPIAASSAAIAKAARYVAPEIRDGTIEETDDAFSAADVYSAGLLALEAFAPGENQSLNEKLDELWQWGAGLAAILEDAFADDAAKRLQIVPRDERMIPFGHLVDCLESEIKVQREFIEELAPVGGARSWLRLIGRPRQIIRMFKVSHQFAGREHDYRRYRRLALWNGVAMLSWLVIWATVLGLIMYHVGTTLHLGWIRGRGNQLGELLLQNFKEEQFPRDLWGRVIAFSFGLMAFTYYTNIYATITFPTSGPRRLRLKARLANAMARSLAIVTPAPCIVGAIVEPRIWPWVTIFGVCWAAASNWSMTRLHHEVWLETKKTVGPDIDPSGYTRHVFNEWALQMTIYAGVVIVLAFTLHFMGRSRVFPVNNVGAYVTGLTFLNLFFIVRLNCIKQAPLMRGFLQRTAFNLRRLTSD